MLENYHTHTTRCRHARGTEREYIETALASGMKVLGFSDHTPYPFRDGHDSGFRMHVEQIDDYFSTLCALKEEYAGRIELHIGFEAEYYPACFGALLQLLHRYPCEYLLLGQHFLENEDTGEYSGNPTAELSVMRRYVDQVIAGMQTGAFSCVAHPDLLNWQGSEELYRQEMRRLCTQAKRLDLPLEINLLGLADGRPYPRRDFWQLAGEVGNRVVIGCDAHEPEALAQPKTEARAAALAAECGLVPERTVALRRP